ncbi:hypothetical protein ACWGMM_15545 [Bacillus subtilis]
MLDALTLFDVDEIRVRFTGALLHLLIRRRNYETIVQLILPVRTY